MSFTNGQTGNAWLSKLDPAAFGVICAFGASMAYGLGTVIARKAVTGAPPLIAAAVSLIAGTMVIAAFSAGHVAKDLKATRKTYIHLALAGMFAGCGLCLLYIALSKAPVVMVSPISSQTPIFSLLFSHLFLQRLERVTLKVVAGTGLVLFGVLLITISGTR